MGRPKKREQRDPLLARTLSYYVWAHKEKWFPDDKDLLHDIIRALLTRLSAIDDQAAVARRAYHAIQLLSVAEESWNDRSSLTRAHMDSDRGAYFGERLCEIAETKPSREEHWKPAFPMQREILEEYLRCEGFPQRGAVEPRVSWLKHNGRDLDALVKSVPCFCQHVTEFSLEHFSEKDLKRAESIGSFVSTVLARLHGITKKSAIKFSKNTQSDGIPIWHPGPELSLPLLEIESRINPPFHPFQSPNQHRNS
ncbi:MAG TPA: hypothetical protein PKK23_15760 [Nitrospirales bacterium]|nr:hypothetical protein [Nitrospiraceae bacterium]HNP30502.1 hypothetical protein [Nitrospirales bacterium]